MDETRAFLVDLNGLPLRGDDVARLSASTDGWVAALQLVSLSLRDSADPAALIRGFSGRHHSIGEYLAENVLDALPAEILDFLLATSVCDRLCGDLAGALAGRADGQAMLEELERRDLFLRPLDAEREWFRYHHLFADHLRRRLERDRPDQVRGCTGALGLVLGPRPGARGGHPRARRRRRRAGDRPRRAQRDAAGRAQPDGQPARSDRAAARRRRGRPPGAADGRGLGELPAPAPAGRPARARPPAPRPAGRRRGDAQRGRRRPGVHRRLRRPHRPGRGAGQPEPGAAGSYRPWVVAVAANIQSFCDIHAMRFQAPGTGSGGPARSTTGRSGRSPGSTGAASPGSPHLPSSTWPLPRTT